MEDPALLIRFPIASDIEAPFEASGGLAGRIAWPDLLGRHDPPRGAFAFVAEWEQEIVGIATLVARPLELEIEFLARNATARGASGQRVGSVLLARALDLARALELPWVTLEALDDRPLIGFYERNGFVRVGPPLFDATWGVLHPMRAPAVTARS